MVHSTALAVRKPRLPSVCPLADCPSQLLVALATEFWNDQEEKIMTVYFQHWTGEIRSIQLTPKGEWIGGTSSEVIASDAKNATPISAVSYSLNDTSVVSSAF